MTYHTKHNFIRLLTVLAALSVICGRALADRLLIERNARPLLAEGSLEALGPWETPIEGFFIRSHHNVMPSVIDDSWQISMTGLLANPKKFTLRDLKHRKSISFHAVLECSGNGRGLFTPQVSGIQWKRGAVGNAEWTGVPLSDLFKDLGVKPEAVYVTVEGFDEPVMKSDAKFVRSIPVKLLLDAGAILAWNMNREPLPLAHGGPVRLAIPGVYGQNWVKWVNKMTFAAVPDERTYAKKAYRMPEKALKPGEPWDPVKQGRPIEYIKVQTLFTSHTSGVKLHPGKITISGKAFTGKGQVEKVEISFDAGATWQQAKLTPIKDHAWQEFSFEAVVEEGKSYEALARATDSQGDTQPMTQEWNPKGYLYNAVERLAFSGDTAGAVLAEGEALANAHCQTCHSIGMAEGQRLSKTDWIKTVKKMADYGLTLPEPDVDKIARFFAQKLPPGTPSDDSKRIDLSADPASFATPGIMPIGNAPRGGKLFAANCASCHGVNGDGKVGPILKGRSITNANFWATVVNGKRAMPPFKDLLTAGQIADIRAWTLSEPHQALRH
jgi:DMSO/TMAO reductase YedYZ molybdopterin-dependent catalytic subunit/mono/diheme cytochrome c family protein